MGSGIVISTPREGPHWDPERAVNGDKGLYVDILFDVLNATPVLGEDALSVPPLQSHDWYPMASGTSIPVEISKELEIMWSDATRTVYIPLSTEELQNIYTEGTKRTRLITTCERNPKARSKCVEHYGARCQVCGLSFDERYGEIGKGFIHVHHLFQMAEINGEYQLDPIQDLRPLCPNCHAMIHKRVPPYTIAELKDKMRSLQQS
jgi:5-methylcytosine-specific restriction protein A